MSADRIFGGILTLGGNNNISGMLNIKDENGNSLVTLDKLGIVLSNGAKLIGSEGVLSNFQFGIFEWSHVGYECWPLSDKNVYLCADVPIFIPENFTVVDARVTLFHSPIHWTYGNTVVYGYCRNLKLYKKEDGSTFVTDYPLDSELQPSEDIATIEVQNAFGSNGFSPSVASSNSCKIEKMQSSNIKNYITPGKNTIFQIRTGNNKPNFAPDIGNDYVKDFQRNVLEATGNVKVVIDVIGYMK